MSFKHIKMRFHHTLFSAKTSERCCIGASHKLLMTSLCSCMISYFSRVRLCVTLWTVAHQAPLSMGFSRQEQWSGLPCPPPGDVPHPGMEPRSLTSVSGRWVPSQQCQPGVPSQKGTDLIFIFLAK